MIAIYLWFNAALYLLLAIYCSIRLVSSAKSLGYLQLDSNGKTEYLTIYGGLELGLAALYGWLASTPTLHPLGLVISLCLYGGIVPFRLFGLLRFKPKGATVWSLAAGEVLMLLAPLILLLLQHNH